MSNLLPRADKHALHMRYLLRVMTVWCYVAAAACAIGTLLLVPSLLIVATNLSAASAELQAQSAAMSSEYTDTVHTIEEANAYTAQLSKDITQTTVTDITQAVNAELGTGIDLAGMTYETSEGNAPAITIDGVAATRDELKSFIDRLKASPYFADAIVPLEQFSQATKATFTATLTLQGESLSGEKKTAEPTP